MRQWGLGGAAFWLVQSFAGAIPAVGPSLGDLIRMRYTHLGFAEGSFPLAPVAGTLGMIAPFVLLALPFNPPPEHGLAAASKWIRQHNLLGADRVSELIGDPSVDEDRVESDFGFHAAWELPSVNLRLADQATVDATQDLWGEFLSGLTTPIQTLTTAHRIDLRSIVDTIASYPSPNAPVLAAWLRCQVINRNLIERRHFVVIVAASESAFADSVREVGEGLGTLGLRDDLIRRLRGDELASIVRRTWSPRPATTDKLGPAGPWTIRSRQIQSDREWHEVLALGKWARVMRDNALAAFIDGPYAVDVIQHIEPVDADDILDAQERRLSAMQASRPDRKRRVALGDLETTTNAFEGGEESPFDVATYFHVHHADRKEVQDEVARLTSRARRSGFRTTNLRWEQPEALLASAPLGVHLLKNRTKRVDTSSVKRAYPLSASAMTLEGGVPYGEALGSRRPILYTPWRRPIINNPHIFVAADSGGGKSFGVKVLESRLLFAGATEEIYGFDQAEEDDDLGELGRFAAYTRIDYRHVRTLADIDPVLRDLWRPGVIWNIASLPVADRPEMLWRTKDELWKLAAKKKMRRQIIFDELWTWVKTAAELDADPASVARALAALEDLVRRGRRMKVGGVFMTQRVRDAANEPIVQVIHSQSASHLYGMQNRGEVSVIAPLLQWTPPEVAAIQKFVAGQFLFVAGQWRVTMAVTSSDEEYEMANTDGEVDREDVRPVAVGPDLDDVSNDAGTSARRNGADHRGHAVDVSAPTTQAAAAAAD